MKLVKLQLKNFCGYEDGEINFNEFKDNRILILGENRDEEGEDRGAHAHKKCHQMIVAASGSFDIFMDDGMNKKSITLNKPYYGLHIPPGIWAAERCFSSGAICLVLTSEIFDEKDYIRDYSDYKIYISEKI